MNEPLDKKPVKGKREEDEIRLEMQAEDNEKEMAAKD